MAAAPGRIKAVATNPDSFPIGVEQEILTRVGCTLVPAVCKSEDETIAACRGATVPAFCFAQVADPTRSLTLSVPRKATTLSNPIRRGVYNRDLARPIHN